MACLLGGLGPLGTLGIGMPIGDLVAAMLILLATGALVPAVGALVDPRLWSAR